MLNSKTSYRFIKQYKRFDDIYLQTTKQEVTGPIYTMKMSTYSYVLFLTVVLALWLVHAEDEESRTNRICVNNKMKRCNEVVKWVFMDATSAYSDLQVYCRAMKALFKCVKNQLRDRTRPCKSKVLRKYHFIVLAYLGMDKIMGTCTQDIRQIQTEVLENLAPDSIKIAEDFVENAFQEDPKVTQCAKAAHASCVKQFTEKEQRDNNLCLGVRDFINCYQIEKCVGDKISESFARLIKRMSDELIRAFEVNSMCVVNRNEL